MTNAYLGISVILALLLCN